MSRKLSRKDVRALYANTFTRQFARAVVTAYRMAKLQGISSEKLFSSEQYRDKFVKVVSDCWREYENDPEDFPFPFSYNFTIAVGLAYRKRVSNELKLGIEEQLGVTVDREALLF